MITPSVIIIMIVIIISIVIVVIGLYTEKKGEMKSVEGGYNHQRQTNESV